MPIIEPEVNIKSTSRAECDQILCQEILRALDGQDADRSVMLKLSIPTEPGLFSPLVNHPKVSRVVALSGGFSRAEACKNLAENKGMIASFSRALLEDLRHHMDDDQFNNALSTAINQIFEASAT